MTKLLVHLRLWWWAVTMRAKIVPYGHDRPGSCPYCVDWTPIYGQVCICGRTGEARYNARVARASIKIVED